MQKCGPRIYVIIPPPLTSRVSFSFPFSLLFEQMGLGKLGKERHSVLINSPHTQTQPGFGDSEKGQLPLHCHGDPKEEVQRKPGVRRTPITISMSWLVREVAFADGFRNHRPPHPFCHTHTHTKPTHPCMLSTQHGQSLFN